MTAPLFYRALVLIAIGFVLGLPAAQAKDRPFDRDWRTGVTVAPGASTWTDDNFEQKKGLINHVALTRGKTCSSYAFLGWPPGSGGGAKILPETRRNYEAAGYTVTEGPGDLPSDAVWTVAKDGREAMILWSAFSGSIIYLSCITAGDPASDPSKPLYVGILLALGLGTLGAGLWLVQRVRSLALASAGWPTTPGVVKSSEVVAYRAQGGRQYETKVTYDYTVGGTPYVGDRVRFGAHAGPKAKADEDVAKYTVGAPVEVYYAPRQPQTATLQPGGSGVSVWGWLLTGTGAALTVLAGVVLFVV
jgi:hypothetical protein